MASTVLGIIATVDFAFKLMLGSPEHTRITIHFLNAVLGDSVKITKVTILNPILKKDYDEDKLSVLDILAEDEHGRKFNIEMQTSVLSELPQRLAYYMSTLYSDQLKEGAGYLELRQSICICVLTKSMFPDDLRLHLDFRMRDQSGLILTNDLQIHLLQLPNLRLTEDNVTRATPIERWAYFLLNADRLSRDDVRRIFPDEEFGEAAGVLEMISKSPEQHRVYDMRLKFLRDEASRRAEIESAQRELAAAQREAEAAQREAEAAQREAEAAKGQIEVARSEGIREGETKGRVEGRVEGIREGIQKGELLGRIAVLQELLGIAKSMPDELSSFDESRLTKLAEQLQTQLRNRGSVH